MKNKVLLPPPWYLRGKGYILLYRFGKKFIHSFGALPERFSFYGGWGSVMVIKYFHSNAGSYDELLFIPGMVEFSEAVFDTVAYTITKIYVSTEISRIHGRENWGIPKETATFYWDKLPKRREIIKVFRDKTKFFELDVEHGSYYIPVSTRFWNTRLQQLHEGKLFLTRFKGQGKATFARIHNIAVIPEYFPPVSKPILAFFVDDFRLEFPEPHIE